MAEKIVINPLTRISGFMEIEAVIENHRVIDAKTKGLMFRGFEKMLIGRSPLDAVYFTERICGICSTAHSVASSLALESAFGIIPKEQGIYLRDIIHGCEFLQNHIRHFYQFTVPDFVKFPDTYPFLKTNHNDFRLPKDKNDRIAENYFNSLEFSRSAHKMLAILGGKAPHNHGVFIGGINSPITADMILSVSSILDLMYAFINDKLIPDVYEIAGYYKEYFHNGIGYGNLLSYGCFYNYKDLDTLYIKPLTYNGKEIMPFNQNGITQSVDYSWYSDSDNPSEILPVANVNKPNAYTFIKTSRYNNMPYEVGPLARQWLSGEYQNGISTMDRTIARALEAKKIISVMKILLQNLVPDIILQQQYSVPVVASGQGLVDTTRGALGHWLIVKDGKISFYQIITPSAWNLSPMSFDMQKGVAEQALIGTYIENMDNPVEIGRVIRSFDPCVSCATHVFHGEKLVDTIEISV